MAIGVSRQLVGDPAFGASGYQYCGSILGAQGDAQFERDGNLLDAAGALAGAVVEEFGVVGLNGIDFIARQGIPYPVEVNPRWSASMELVERAYGLSIIGGHAAACAAGRLPAFDLGEARRRPGALGKAIVFARRNLVARDTSTWRTTTGDVRDIPRTGSRIPAGRPVCTVFAEGADAGACYGALVARAERIYAQLDAWYA
jgi:predicted ATP-grasp superfamily ATP-dependent carboligase